MNTLETGESVTSREVKKTISGVFCEIILIILTFIIISLENKQYQSVTREGAPRRTRQTDQRGDDTEKQAGETPWGKTGFECCSTHIRRVASLTSFLSILCSASLSSSVVILKWLSPSFGILFLLVLNRERKKLPVPGAPYPEMIPPSQGDNSNIPRQPEHLEPGLEVKSNSKMENPHFPREGHAVTWHGVFLAMFVCG